MDADTGGMGHAVQVGGEGEGEGKGEGEGEGEGGGGQGGRVSDGDEEGG